MIIQKQLAIALLCLALLLASCSGANNTAPEAGWPRFDRSSCDHCNPGVGSSKDGFPAQPEETLYPLKINANGTTLVYQKPRFSFDLYFLDLESNKKWSIPSSGLSDFDSMQIQFVESFIEWSPYDPDRALVIAMASTGSTDATYRIYQLLAFFNVRTRKIERLAVPPIPRGIRVWETAANTIWLRSSTPGNDTIVAFLGSQGAYQLHVQSGTKLSVPFFDLFLAESSKSGRYLTRTQRGLSEQTMISGMALDVLHDTSATVRAYAWSPDARYLSLLVRNLRYDTSGRNPNDTVFFETWPCNNTELWVFDIDELMQKRDPAIKPLFRTNLQSAYCLFAPVPSTIASTSRGTLLIALQTPFSETIPIYELSLNGDIIRKVIENP